MSIPYYPPDLSKPKHSANYTAQENLSKDANNSIHGNFSLQPSESGSFKASTGGGPTDVVNDFAWTFSKYRDEVPRVRLIERQITANQQRLYMTKIPANASSEDPYITLYEQAKKTGFEYILPYITSNFTSLAQRWSEQCPPEGSGLIYSAANAAVQAGGAVAGAVGGSALRAAGTVRGSPRLGRAAGGVAENMFSGLSIDSIARGAIKAGGSLREASFWGIDQPMYYSGGKKQSFKIRFPLFNTFSVEHTQKHIDFIRIFKYQNLYDRVAFAAYNPPVIYESKFADGHRTDIGEKPALFVSNFSVVNLGSVHSIDIGSGGKTAVPEAFMIDIELTEMITTSRAIYSASFSGGSIVNVYG